MIKTVGRSAANEQRHDEMSHRGEHRHRCASTVASQEVCAVEGRKRYSGDDAVGERSGSGQAVTVTATATAGTNSAPRPMNRMQQLDAARRLALGGKKRRR